MNRKSPEQYEAALTEAILRFLAEQPQAATLEKISEWWLARQPIHIDIHAVARAVQLLTEQGVLEGLGEGPSRRYQLRNPKP